MVQRDGNFQCDKGSKERVMKKLKEYYENNSNLKFKYWIDPNPIADIDCYATGYTKDNRIVSTYAIEVKERKKIYDEMFCEVKKYNDLKKTKANYSKQYVANEMPNSDIYIWDFEDIDPNHYEWKWISKTTKGNTDKDKEKIKQKRILMPLTKGIQIK